MKAAPGVLHIAYKVPVNLKILASGREKAVRISSSVG